MLDEPWVLSSKAGKGPGRHVEEMAQRQRSCGPPQRLAFQDTLPKHVAGQHLTGHTVVLVKHSNSSQTATAQHTHTRDELLPGTTHALRRSLHQSHLTKYIEPNPSPAV